jgi:hypothetical protein
VAVAFLHVPPRGRETHDRVEAAAVAAQRARHARRRQRAHWHHVEVRLRSHSPASPTKARNKLASSMVHALWSWKLAALGAGGSGCGDADTPAENSRHTSDQETKTQRHGQAKMYESQRNKESVLAGAGPSPPPSSEQGLYVWLPNQQQSNVRFGMMPNSHLGIVGGQQPLVLRLQVEAAEHLALCGAHVDLAAWVTRHLGVRVDRALCGAHVDMAAPGRRAFRVYGRGASRLGGRAPREVLRWTYC